MIDIDQIRNISIVSTHRNVIEVFCINILHTYGIFNDFYIKFD